MTEITTTLTEQEWQMINKAYLMAGDQFICIEHFIAHAVEAGIAAIQQEQLEEQNKNKVEVD